MNAASGPPRVTGVGASSHARGRVLVTFTAAPTASRALRALRASHFVMTAYGAETGCVICAVVHEERDKLRNSFEWVNEEAFYAGRLVIVRVCAAFCQGNLRFTSERSCPSNVVRVGGLHSEECAALEYGDGEWPASLHSGAQRAKIVRGLGLILEDRLVENVPASLLRSIRGVACSTFAMRVILKYATPHCTLSDREECSIASAMCWRDDAKLMWDALANGALDPNATLKFTSYHSSLGPHVVEIPRINSPDARLSLIGLAAQVGRHDIIKALARFARFARFTTGADAVVLAIVNGSLGALKALIAAGVELNNDHLWHALRVASRPEMLSEILGTGTVNINSTFGPFHLSAISTVMIGGGTHAKLIAIKYIVRNCGASGTIVNVRSGRSGSTAIHTAVQSDVSNELFEFLIAANVNVNARMKDGTTPLNMAITMNRPRIVNILIEAGADIDARGPPATMCRTPLCFAIDLGASRIALLLIEKGADVNKRSIAAFGHFGSFQDDDAPLHVAARKGDDAVVTKLIAAGADVNSVNAKGYTPLTIALRYNRTSVLNTITSAEINV